MKNTYRFLILLSFSLFLVSCTWQIPKSVAVKTGAVYNFGIGEIEKDYSEYFSSGKILDSSTTSDRSKLYDYFPGEKDNKLQKYLMKLPIQDIPVDFTAYFNSTDLAESITDLSFKKDITVPALLLSMDEKIPLDAVYSGINAMLTGTGTAPDTTVYYTGSFTSVKYTSGTMNITCASSAANGTATLSYKGSVLATGIVVSGKTSLDISGKTIYKSGMTLELPTGSGKFQAAIAKDSVIKEVRGLTLPASIKIPFSAAVTNKNDSGDFVDCTIGKGSLDLNIDIPKTWTNTSVEYDVELTGAIKANSEATVGNAKSVSLDGRSLTNGSTSLSSNIVLTFSESDIDFTTGPQLTAATNISSFASIGIVLKDVDTSLNETEPISKEMCDSVERLILDASGLAGSYINTFPEGNNITIGSSSDFIGLADTSVVLTSNKAETTGFKLTSAGTKTVKFREEPQAADEYSEMDFKINIGLPGSTAENPNQIKVVNVAPETTYTIEFELKPDINWESITLYSQGTVQTNFESTGLNVNQLFKSFSDVMGSDFDGKITLKTLPVSIYSVRPDMASFAQADFKGSLDMLFCVENEDGSITRKDEYGCIKFMPDGTMPFAKQMPVINMSSKTIISDIDEYAPSRSGDLKDICNNAKEETTGSIYVDYSLQFTNPGVSGETFTITYKDFVDSGTTVSSIAIYAYVQLPLDFNLSEDTPINLLTLAGKKTDADILGRSEALTELEYNEFISAVRKVEINYTSSQVPFYGIPAASIRLDLDGPNNDYYEASSIDMKGGKFTVTSFNELLRIYPLLPAVDLLLHEGEFTVPRDIKMISNISMSIEMDPDRPITIWGGK